MSDLSNQSDLTTEKKKNATEIRSSPGKIMIENRKPRKEIKVQKIL